MRSHCRSLFGEIMDNLSKREAKICVIDKEEFSNMFKYGIVRESYFL
jgi:hypothetical protein